MSNLTKYEAEKILPDVDILETTETFILKSEMPGVDKNGLEISVDKNILNIKGVLSQEVKNLISSGQLKYREFKVADYERSFNLGNSVDVEKINAHIENGVLSLTLPKSESLKPKRIEISYN